MDRYNAKRFATCKIVGWDIAIDEDENPILIEAKLNCPGITIEQACSGPIFGKFTSETIESIDMTKE